MQGFDFDRLTEADRKIADHYTGLRQPDFIISPDGEPYLYRWHVIDRWEEANVYFHVQVADDPERPLHDHPWDNMSVILSGGYEELLKVDPMRDHQQRIVRNKGDVIFRKATWAHRLLMRPGHPYSISQFATGPKVRDWGFWYPTGWRSYKQVTKKVGNESIHINRGDDHDH